MGTEVFWEEADGVEREKEIDIHEDSLPRSVVLTYLDEHWLVEPAISQLAEIVRRYDAPEEIADELEAVVGGDQS